MRQMLLPIAVSISLFACGSDEAPKEAVVRPVLYETVTYWGAGRTREFSGIARAAAGIQLELPCSRQGCERCCRSG